MRGRRLNEDTYSVQLLSVDQKLVTLRKPDLQEYQVVRKSAMPSYKGTFSDMELRNLLGYMASLQLAR